MYQQVKATQAECKRKRKRTIIWHLPPLNVNSTLKLFASHLQRCHFGHIRFRSTWTSLWNVLTFEERAQSPDGDRWERCELSERRLHEEEWHSAHGHEQQVRDQKHGWKHNIRSTIYHNIGQCMAFQELAFLASYLSHKLTRPLEYGLQNLGCDNGSKNISGVFAPPSPEPGVPYSQL